MICLTKKSMSFSTKIFELKPWTGEAGRNGRCCRYECPDCAGPTRITKTAKLVTTGGRRLSVSCKDQDECMWTGQVWEGPAPGLAWRKFDYSSMQLKQSDFLND